jgi:hypothetical protein
MRRTYSKSKGVGVREHRTDVPARGSKFHDRSEIAMGLSVQTTRSKLAQVPGAVTQWPKCARRIRPVSTSTASVSTVLAHTIARPNEIWALLNYGRR